MDNLDLNFYSLNSRPPTDTYYIFLVLLILLVFSLLLSDGDKGKETTTRTRPVSSRTLPTLILTNR